MVQVKSRAKKFSCCQLPLYFTMSVRLSFPHIYLSQFSSEWTEIWHDDSQDGIGQTSKKNFFRCDQSPLYFTMSVSPSFLYISTISHRNGLKLGMKTFYRLSLEQLIVCKLTLVDTKKIKQSQAVTLTQLSLSCLIWTSP